MRNKLKSTRKYTFGGHVKDLGGFTPSVIEYHYPAVKEQFSKLGIPHQWFPKCILNNYLWNRHFSVYIFF